MNIFGAMSENQVSLRLSYPQLPIGDSAGQSENAALAHRAAIVDGRKMLPVKTNVQICARLDYHLHRPADVLLAVEASAMADQKIIENALIIDGANRISTIDGSEQIGRRTWFHGDGPISIRYAATIAIERSATALAGLDTDPLAALPADIIPYLMPSRYCPSDRFENFAATQFSASSKGQLVIDMAQWVFDALSYTPGNSNGSTTAADTFLSRQGVCRDFAHLLISLCRASDIPARMVSAYALDINPPDFHAIVEVYLAGAWHLIDPSQMAPETNLVRIAVGRDATDVGFMTIFGSAQMVSQTVTVARL